MCINSRNRGRNTHPAENLLIMTHLPIVGCKSWKDTTLGRVNCVFEVSSLEFSSLHRSEWRSVCRSALEVTCGSFKAVWNSSQSVSIDVYALTYSKLGSNRDELRARRRQRRQRRRPAISGNYSKCRELMCQNRGGTSQKWFTAIY